MSVILLPILGLNISSRSHRNVIETIIYGHILDLYTSLILIIISSTILFIFETNYPLLAAVNCFFSE